MKMIGIVLVLAASAAFAQEKKITGVVTDTMCGKDHASMGASDPVKCTRECVKSDPSKWKYALSTANAVYVFADQQQAEKFAGRSVSVTGTIDAKAKTVRASKIDLGR